MTYRFPTVTEQKKDAVYAKLNTAFDLIDQARIETLGESRKFSDDLSNLNDELGDIIIDFDENSRFDLIENDPDY